MAQQPKGVLLLGSIPLSDTESVLRKCSTTLGPHIRYLPDGETGERGNFIAWQIGKHMSAPEVLSPYGSWGAPSSTPISQDAITAAANKLRGMNTDYDTEAIKSYAVFRRLRDEGVIAPGVKFQVGIPSPATWISAFMTHEFKAAIEPIYAEAIYRAVSNIVSAIPAEDLVIQWDVPLEFAMLEGVFVIPWFPAVKEGILERLVTLAEKVDANVEMGYHFCYGDIGHTHFKEPENMQLMVEVALHILENVQRKVDFIHMPVPKARDDVEYFSALWDLKPRIGDTKIYLGLVHAHDVEGTKRRIGAAREVFGGHFGVGSECGLGRTATEDIDSIFEISKEVSEPW